MAKQAMSKNPVFDREICQFIHAKANGTSEGELWIYGDITDDKWYDSDVTPAGIRDALKDMGDIKILNIRVNSLGGNVFAGNAIQNIIDSYRRKTNCKVHAYIDGIAASMGSNIPMVADKIYAADNSLYMLHKPLAFAYGNANDLEKAKEMLDKAEITLINNYMRHFTGTEDELKQMLSDETWLTADEALSYGLCDEVIASVSVAASAKTIKYGAVDFLKEKLPVDFIKETDSDDTRKEDKRDMSRFKYDSALMDRFGIDEAAFAAFGVSSESVVAIVEAASAKLQTPAKAESDEAEEAEEADEAEETEKPEGEEVEPAGEAKPAEVKEEVAVAEDRVKAALGVSVTNDQLLELAVAGKKYKALCDDAIEDAIKQGIRAYGEKFNEDRWRKTFSAGQFDLTDIQEQSDEWNEMAKADLKAGKRVSVPATDADGKVKRPAVAPKDML
jgi:ATP-dependent protease ClpP protease subunit